MVKALIAPMPGLTVGDTSRLAISPHSMVHRLLMHSVWSRIRMMLLHVMMAKMAKMATEMWRCAMSPRRMFTLHYRRLLV
tara:strand:+ start:5568 stop:5807 length:240 start_codon:yes stop_codon:yes gene_type:complete